MGSQLQYLFQTLYLRIALPPTIICVYVHSEYVVTLVFFPVCGGKFGSDVSRVPAL